MAKPKSAILSTVVTPIKQSNTMVEHIENAGIHVDQNLRDNINYIRNDIELHSKNENIHVTSAEKASWNNKETTAGCQSKVNKVMNSLQVHINDKSMHLTANERELLKNIYTKSEVRQLVKHTLTGLTFLKSVITRSDLNIKYPNPKFNSCVYIKSEKMNVVYNGEEWVNWFSSPEVNEYLDEYITKLENIEEFANNYIHPNNIDTRHVSDTQIDYWNKKADNILATNTMNGLMSSDDKIKLNNIEENSNNYTHPEYHDPSIIKQDKNNRFVSDEEKTSWNSKVDGPYVQELSKQTLVAAKSIIDSKVANIFNSTKDQLEVINSLAFELKNNETVKNFIDLYNSCTKNKDFEDHVLNDKIHMSRSDISLLNNVKSLIESGALEVNIPESLPADGGNADTVGNYNPEELLNNRDFYDYTIGTSDYDLTKTSVIIKKGEEVNVLNTLLGSNILIRPGSYNINDELVIKASNSTIRGIGQLSILTGALIRIVGDNNTIENISLVNGNDKIVNGTAIIIQGNNNIIKSNTIMNYNKGIIVEGSNNKIIDNLIINIRYEAIKLTSTYNSNYGNIIDKNDIRRCNMGIVIMSSDNFFLSRNHIINNNIINCNSGIILTNMSNDYTKTTMNIISQNIIIRGNGGSSDYLPTQKSIISEFSSKNIISQNITSGKEIIAPNDVLSNNLY